MHARRLFELHDIDVELRLILRPVPGSDVGVEYKGTMCMEDGWWGWHVDLNMCTINFRDRMAIHITDTWERPCTSSDFSRTNTWPVIPSLGDVFILQPNRSGESAEDATFLLKAHVVYDGPQSSRDFQYLRGIVHPSAWALDDSYIEIGRYVAYDLDHQDIMPIL